MSLYHCGNSRGDLRGYLLDTVVDKLGPLRVSAQHDLRVWALRSRLFGQIRKSCGASCITTLEISQNVGWVIDPLDSDVLRADKVVESVKERWPGQLPNVPQLERATGEYDGDGRTFGQLIHRI